MKLLYIYHVANCIVWDSQPKRSYLYSGSKSIFNYKGRALDEDILQEADITLVSIKEDNFFRKQFMQQPGMFGTKQMGFNDDTPCEIPGLKDKEPWKSFCKAMPHEYCKTNDVPIWTSWFNHWMGKPLDYEHYYTGNDDSVRPNSIGSNNSSGFGVTGAKGHEVQKDDQGNYYMCLVSHAAGNMFNSAMSSKMGYQEDSNRDTAYSPAETFKQVFHFDTAYEKSLNPLSTLLDDNHQFQEMLLPWLPLQRYAPNLRRNYFVGRFLSDRSGSTSTKEGRNGQTELEWLSESSKSKTNFTVVRLYQKPFFTTWAYLRNREYSACSTKDDKNTYWHCSMMGGIVFHDREARKDTKVSKKMGGRRYVFMNFPGRFGCTGELHFALNNEYNYWANYLQTPSKHLWSDIQELAERHLPYWMGHPKQAALYKVWADTMVNANLGSIGCWKESLYFSSRYLGAFFNNLGLDPEIKNRALPVRLMVEDKEEYGKFWTWLKWKETGHPYLLAASAEDVKVTMCGNGQWTYDETAKKVSNSSGTCQGWSDWEVRQANIRCYTTTGCFMFMDSFHHATWVSFKMEYTLEKKTNLTHCHQHIYVPENKTMEQWSKKVCTDPRGCLPILHVYNPCIHDFREEQMKGVSGPLPANTNITWPRGGTWDHNTKVFTFNDTAMLANKDVYPYDSVNIPINEEYLCSPTGGWYGGSNINNRDIKYVEDLYNHHVRHQKGPYWDEFMKYQKNKGGYRLNTLLGDGSMYMPGDTYDTLGKRKFLGLINYGRKRRGAQRAEPFVSEYDSLYPNGNSWDMHNVTGFARTANDVNSILSGEAEEIKWMDDNFPNYFASSFNSTELNWMKWGAFNYLNGYVEGDKSHTGTKGLYIGISDIMTMEDSLDARYPMCTGDNCPNSCGAGTTADVVIDCFMAIDYTILRRTRTAVMRNIGGDIHQQAISIVKDDSSCHYKILIETDCRPYIVFFSVNPGQEGYANEFWKNEKMLPLNDISMLVQDFYDQSLNCNDMNCTSTADDQKGRALAPPSGDLTTTEIPTTNFNTTKADSSAKQRNYLLCLVIGYVILLIIL